MLVGQSLPTALLILLILLDCTCNKRDFMFESSLSLFFLKNIRGLLWFKVRQPAFIAQSLDTLKKINNFFPTKIRMCYDRGNSNQNLLVTHRNIP